MTLPLPPFINTKPHLRLELPHLKWVADVVLYVEQKCRETDKHTISWKKSEIPRAQVSVPYSQESLRAWFWAFISNSNKFSHLVLKPPTDSRREQLWAGLRERLRKDKHFKNQKNEVIFWKTNLHWTLYVNTCLEVSVSLSSLQRPQLKLRLSDLTYVKELEME